MSLYCAAKEAGKHIAIVTDMYLPLEQIVRMLQKIGAGDYDTVLLSSQLGFSKANGGMYRYLKRMGIPAKRFLQIGDNRIADVENPCCLGLNGMWLPAASAVFQHYGRLYPAIAAEQAPLAVRCSVAIAVNAYFDDPFRMMRRGCDWNADPYYMGLLLPTAEHLPEVVTQDFMFQRGQERALQLAKAFFGTALPSSQAAAAMLCSHAEAADRGVFPEDAAWTARCTPCPFLPLPEPKRPAKWKTRLRLLRQAL